MLGSLVGKDLCIGGIYNKDIVFAHGAFFLIFLYQVSCDHLNKKFKSIQNLVISNDIFSLALWCRCKLEHSFTLNIIRRGLEATFVINSMRFMCASMSMLGTSSCFTYYLHFRVKSNHAYYCPKENCEGKDRTSLITHLLNLVSSTRVLATLAFNTSWACLSRSLRT